MSNEELEQEIKSQQKVFISLIVLTLVSVGIAMSGVDGVAVVIVALGIAFVQGLMILGNLMHLKESWSMRGLIGLSAFFLAYLLLATVLAYSNHIEGTYVLRYTPDIELSLEHIK